VLLDVLRHAFRLRLALGVDDGDVAALLGERVADALPQPACSMSSNPTTQRSPGTESPKAVRAASMKPQARRSVTQKPASGRAEPLSKVRPASNPAG